MDGIASQPKTTHSQKYIHLYLEIPPICQAGMAIMDGHADADRLPIQKMRRYIRHIFQISASMRIAKNIRMAIPKLDISPLTSQKNISQLFF